MDKVMLVMLGGAVGSGARYGVGLALANWLGRGFPWGTLAVNLLGGVLMGALVALLGRAGDAQEASRALLGIGVLGGFTTFSSFALDAVMLAGRGAVGLSALYIAISVAGAIGGVLLGTALGRALA